MSTKSDRLNTLYDVCSISPLQKVSKLSKKLGNNVYLKREDLQTVHSFKIRGAYNKMITLTDSQLKSGVIAASAGNHAQGVALSAQKLGVSALIVMPKTTPQIKVDAVISYGAEVILHGDNYSETYAKCQQLTKQTVRTFIHPFDDQLVIDGQGSIAKEILDELPTAEIIFVPIGGGGLIAGIAQYAKKINPDIKIIGVEPTDSNAMQLSLLQNRRVSLDHVGIFSDGVAVKQVGELTFSIVKQHVDEVNTVSVDQVCAGIKSIFEDTRAIVEPAGALSVAGAEKYTKMNNLSNKNMVCILSGANLTFERLQFIAERTLIGSGKEVLFAIKLPESPGALHKLCLEVINGYSISELSYRYNSGKEALIFIGLNVSSPIERNKIKAKLSKYQYDYYDLTFDEIAKEHTRYMIGGKINQEFSEIILEVNFPERPSALLEFLEKISDNWNISLFHYRGLGSDNGRVLIGFRCDDWTVLKSLIESTGYDYTKVDSTSLEAFIR
ncbi:threonine ammonia-lyase, biosynthetic [Candidatus Saccharibacteria bacterium]|nr:threonine ammonia-lyase, biosynthetic [Candidatus Saccharibacteria bacterium]